LATVLAGLNVVIGGSMLAAVAWVWAQDSGLLFGVGGPVIAAVASAGTWVTVAAISHTSRLYKGETGVRIQTLAVGLGLLLLGLGLVLVVPWLGALLVLYGAAMAWLMLTGAANLDLGGWTQDLSRWPRPKRELTLIPSRKALGASDAAPWWEQLRSLERQGLPVVLEVAGALAVLLFAITGVLLLRDGGVFGLASGLTLSVGTGLAWLVYRRLRTRAQL